MKAESFYGSLRGIGDQIAIDHRDCVLVGNVTRPGIALIPKCRLMKTPELPDGSIDVEELKRQLSSVPLHKQVFLFNIDEKKLYLAERATVVNVNEMKQVFGLKEIETDTKGTGLRLFYRG